MKLITSYVSVDDKKLFESILTSAINNNKLLHSDQNPYKNITGWINLPSETKEQDLENLLKFINDFKKQNPILVVAGIGGSYLGAKAIISALSKDFRQTEVIFTGYNLNELAYKQLIDYLEDKDFGVCVISKSGTTTETAVAFRILWKLLYKKYGNKAHQKIIAITSKNKGALIEMAKKYDYHTFFIPDDIGGRYSVLTPVGLVPIAFAGFDIKKLINGAKDIAIKLSENHSDNPAIKYAAIRNYLYQKGYKIEILVSYFYKLTYFAEWWKQLFGESEGKQNKGIFPASATFTTDLHSLGQYIQQGEKILFETIINITADYNLIQIYEDKDNLDGLNYLAGKYIEQINQKAFEGTLKAHTEGGVPNIIIEIPKIDEYHLGQLIYFFEKSCAISGLTLGVNPFDQPGVEFYKRNMFKLLGKPGF